MAALKGLSKLLATSNRRLSHATPGKRCGDSTGHACAGLVGSRFEAIVASRSLRDSEGTARRWPGDFRDHTMGARVPDCQGQDPSLRYGGCILTDRKSTRLNSSHQIISYA